MSHYAKTPALQIKGLSELVLALRHMGVTAEVHVEAQTLMDWHGHPRPEKAHVIIRRQHRGQPGKENSRLHGHASPARLLADNCLQPHRHGDGGGFLLRALRRNGDNDGPRPPQGERERDVGDAIGEAQSDTGAGSHTKRLQLGGPTGNIFNQSGIRNSVVPVNQRRFKGPTAGRAIQ